MHTKQHAKRLAKKLSDLHGEEWVIFKTPDDAPINQSPLNLFNKGRYGVCKKIEQQEYEDGGCVF